MKETRGKFLFNIKTGKVKFKKDKNGPFIIAEIPARETGFPGTAYKYSLDPISPNQDNSWIYNFNEGNYDK